MYAAAGQEQFGKKSKAVEIDDARTQYRKEFVE